MFITKALIDLCKLNNPTNCGVAEQAGFQVELKTKNWLHGVWQTGLSVLLALDRMELAGILYIEFCLFMQEAMSLKLTFRQS